MRRALLTGLLGVILATAAAAFGPTPLMLPGCALVLLSLGALAWVGLAGRGSIKRRVATTRVIEGDPCRLTLEARTWIGTPPGSELVDPYAPESEAPAEWRRAHRLETEVSFSGRGRLELEPARLVVRDPLGIAARELRSASGPEVLVLPRVFALTVGRHGGTSARGDTPAAVQTVEEGARIELDTLREALPGAPATRIHWPAVARTGNMIERTLLPETGHRPLVVLDAVDPSSAEALDRAVRAAASLSVALARAGGCDLLLPGERRPSHLDPKLVAWPALHVRLALVQEGERGFLNARLARAGTIFWVTGREGAGASDLPSGLLRGAAARRYLVAPGAGSAGSAFTVAGCHARRVGRGGGRAAA